MGNSQPKDKSGSKAPRGGRKPGVAEEKKAEQSVSGDGM